VVSVFLGTAGAVVLDPQEQRSKAAIKTKARLFIIFSRNLIEYYFTTFETYKPFKINLQKSCVHLPTTSFITVG